MPTIADIAGHLTEIVGQLDDEAQETALDAYLDMLSFIAGCNPEVGTAANLRLIAEHASNEADASRAAYEEAIGDGRLSQSYTQEAAAYDAIAAYARAAYARLE